MKHTTAGMQEVEQCREQLPSGIREACLRHTNGNSGPEHRVLGTIPVTLRATCLLPGKPIAIRDPCLPFNLVMPGVQQVHAATVISLQAWDNTGALRLEQVDSVIRCISFYEGQVAQYRERRAPHAGRAVHVDPVPVSDQVPEPVYGGGQSLSLLAGIEIPHGGTHHLQAKPPPVNAMLLIVDAEMGKAFIMLQGQDGRCTGLSPDAVEVRSGHGAAANEEIFPDLVPVQGPDPHILENRINASRLLHQKF